MRPSPLLAALRERRLYKRASSARAAELPPRRGEWIADDRALVVAVEDALARELGLAPGELLLDYPEKTQMLGLDLPVLRRDGSVRRLTAEGLGGRDQPAQAVGGALPDRRAGCASSPAGRSR